jgi:hypothetical protein
MVSAPPAQPVEVIAALHVFAAAVEVNANLPPRSALRAGCAVVRERRKLRCIQRRCRPV